MSKNLSELIESENKKINSIKQKRDKDIQSELTEKLGDCNIFVDNSTFRNGDYSEYYRVDYHFTINDYTQYDFEHWNSDESIETFINKICRHIDYIKELREKHPELCKQNDFIQSNRQFKREFAVSHSGYEQNALFAVDLCDYMKMPNRTKCSVGGGDYEIKRTPKRVIEYNENIDRTINFLIDCIADLKSKKLVVK